MFLFLADIEAECQDDFMKIRVGFNGSFAGLVYSAGMFPQITNRTTEYRKANFKSRTVSYRAYYIGASFSTYHYILFVPYYLFLDSHRTHIDPRLYYEQ